MFILRALFHLIIVDNAKIRIEDLRPSGWEILSRIGMDPMGALVRVVHIVPRNWALKYSNFKICKFFTVSQDFANSESWNTVVSQFPYLIPSGVTSTAQFGGNGNSDSGVPIEFVSSKIEEPGMRALKLCNEPPEIVLLCNSGW